MLHSGCYDLSATAVESDLNSDRILLLFEVAFMAHLNLDSHPADKLTEITSYLH